MTPSFRTKVMNEQLIDPYIIGINILNITLFDPGGERKYVMNSSRGVIPKLFGKAHGTCDNGLEGVDWGESIMKNDADADRVLEGMLHSNSIGIQGAKDILDENVNVVLDASGLMYDTFWTDLLVESILQGEKSQVDLLEDSTCKVFNELVKPNSTYLQLAWEYRTPAVTESVEQTLSAGVGKPSVINMECLKVVSILFDGLLTQFSVKHNIWSEGHGKWDRSMVEFKEDTMEMMCCEIVLFTFDPGIGYWPLIGCDSITSPEMCNNSVVYLWIGKMLLCSDPGGNTFVLGTWGLRNTHSIGWDRLFEDTGWYIVHIVEGEDPGAQRKDFLAVLSSRRRILMGHAIYICNFSLRGPAANYLSSCDTSALKAFNGYPMKKTNTSRFSPFDVFQQTYVFLKMLVDHSNFTLLIPFYSTQNGRYLCDLVMSQPLFIDRILWPVVSTKIHVTSQAIQKVMALYMFCPKVLLQLGDLQEIKCSTFSIVNK